MYKDYFGLKEDPFSIAPDPQFLYMSERHREALAHLIYGLKMDSGFVLLTGEVGTGKTTVCRCLLGQIPENSEIAFILNPKLSVSELLATICDELQISYPAGSSSVKIFVDLINRFLLDAHSKGKRTVLIIDEAQNLRVDVLEQIRLLTNLETDKHKLLQVIMLGQPELNQILERPELRQLSQRITARYHLEPLARNELEGYLAHRLAIAGVERPLFSKGTMNKLYRLSGGVPRLINLLCDRALLGAYVRGQNMISPALLSEAANEVFGKKSRKARAKGSPLQWLLAITLLVVLLASSAVLFLLIRQSVSQNTVTGTEPIRETVIEKPEGFSPIHWASSEPVSRSEALALLALLRLWGHQDEDLAGDPRAVAADHGLGRLAGKGSLGKLRRLNRPAVLRLSAPERDDFYVTLAGLGDQVATLIIGSDLYQVPLAALTRQWYGEYELFWQPPPGYDGSLKPGDRVSVVHWLERKMAQLFTREARSQKDLHFDELLLREVERFQAEEGFDPDGLVGPLTLIVLNSRTGGNQPTLLDE